MSKGIQLARCPYCHKKISYLGASILRKKGEYQCTSCTCTSNVVIRTALYAIASLVCVLALLITVLYSMLGDHGSINGVLLVLCPFMIFYLIAPFFVQLTPYKETSSVKTIPEKQSVQTARRAPERPAEPTEKIYHRPEKSITYSQPIELDVEEDFSAKFMRAKNNLAQKQEESSAGDDNPHHFE